MASETLTWDSEADWDDAQDERGVVHEHVDDTGYIDPTEVRAGYSVESPVPSADLVGYWPGHESSGDTSYDVSGNGNHGTLINGTDVGATGILGNNAYECDSSNSERIEYPTVSIGTSSWTVCQWVYVTSYDSYLHIFSSPEQDKFACKVSEEDGAPYFFSQDDRTETTNTDEEIPFNEWTFVVYRYDGDEIAIFLNGDKTVSNAGNNLDIDDFEPRIQGGNGEYANARHMETRLYKTDISGSDISDMYDVAADLGFLTTAEQVS